MALISCPECGKKVSSMALSCPECGCPISAQPAPVVQQSFEADIQKLTVLARRARQGSDNSTAKKYYDQILTLKLAGPTVINCHVGRGFKDAVLFYGGEENAKYKLIPNSRTGLRIEATPYF